MDYRLDDLGWYQFERLCQALLRVAHGADLETWGGNHDQGREAYSEAALRYPGTKVEDGPFAFQAKFVAGANSAGANPRSALLNACRSEASEIVRRLESDIWDKEPRFYTLMTNVTLTPTLRQDVERIFSDALLTARILQVGGTEISAELDNRPALRNAYPQILGLRDLQQMISRAVSIDVINRSDFAISLAMELSRVFVPTAAYSKAQRVLDEWSFAVLLGPPEMGKTAIARMIGLTRYLNGWEVFECHGPDDLHAVYLKDRSQLFIADDAFGSTEYRPNIAMDWAHELEGILARMDKTHALVWTTRPGPLNEGLRQLHFSGSSGDFDPKEVLVNASELSVPEKAQILYRHAKAATLDEDAASAVRNAAVEVISSPHFTPLRMGLLMQRLTHSEFGKILRGSDTDAIQEAVEAVLEQRTPSMMTAIETLSAEHRAILICMLAYSGRISLERLETSCHTFLGRPFERSFLSLLEDMEHHFVVIIRSRTFAPRAFADWVHPSMRDCCIEYLRIHDGDRLRFISTASTEAIVLALSSAGGSEGQLEAPLLVGNQDWQALSSRVLEISESPSPDAHADLLAALAGPYRLEDSDDVQIVRRHLQSLVCEVLPRIASVWNQLRVALPLRAVETYFALAEYCSYSESGPDLTATWMRHRDGLSWGDPEYVQSFSDTLSWYALLERVEPELISRTDDESVDQGEPRIRDLIELHVNSIGGRIDRLQELDPEEDEIVEIDDYDGSHETEAPVMPSSTEEEEVEWLESVKPILAELSISPFIRFHVQIREWARELESHLDVRNQRFSRYEEYREGDNEPNYDRTSLGGEGIFDVRAFFSDL